MTPADGQEEAGEPSEDDNVEGLLRLGDETSLSQVEAAVVIDEMIYGRDPLRCLPCINKVFARTYDRI